MKTLFLEKILTYDGTQLRSRWIEETSGLCGDAIVAFCGPADVPIENMVDLEDVAANAPIYSENMLHFIIEHFDRDLEKMVLRQRLLITMIEAELKNFSPCRGLVRKGDDLYDGHAKLSVSIATTSPISSLIHTALNITSRNTPVKTIGLEDYDLSPKTLANIVLARYQQETKEIQHACTKVRPVA